MGEGRCAGDAGAVAEQEGVADDLALLFDAVAVERLAGLQRIIVTAEGVTGERQADAPLMLPDMHRLAKSNTEGRNIGVIAGG